MKDIHYEEYAADREYCGYLLKKKAFYILAGTFIIGNLAAIAAFIGAII